MGEHKTLHEEMGEHKTLQECGQVLEWLRKYVAPTSKAEVHLADLPYLNRFVSVIVADVMVCMEFDQGVLVSLMKSTPLPVFVACILHSSVDNTGRECATSTGVEYILRLFNTNLAKEAKNIQRYLDIYVNWAIHYMSGTGPLVSKEAREVILGTENDNLNDQFNILRQSKNVHDIAISNPFRDSKVHRDTTELCLRVTTFPDQYRLPNMSESIGSQKKGAYIAWVRDIYRLQGKLKQGWYAQKDFKEVVQFTVEYVLMPHLSINRENVTAILPRVCDVDTLSDPELEYVRAVFLGDGTGYALFDRDEALREKRVKTIAEMQNLPLPKPTAAESGSDWRWDHFASFIRKITNKDHHLLYDNVLIHVKLRMHTNLFWLTLYSVYVDEQHKEHWERVLGYIWESQTWKNLWNMALGNGDFSAYLLRAIGTLESILKESSPESSPAVQKNTDFRNSLQKLTTQIVFKLLQNYKVCLDNENEENGIALNGPAINEDLNDPASNEDLNGGRKRRRVNIASSVYRRVKGFMRSMKEASRKSEYSQQEDAPPTPKAEDAPPTPPKKTGFLGYFNQIWSGKGGWAGDEEVSKESEPQGAPQAAALNAATLQAGDSNDPQGAPQAAPPHKDDYAAAPGQAGGQPQQQPQYQGALQAEAPPPHKDDYAAALGQAGGQPHQQPQSQGAPQAAPPNDYTATLGIVVVTALILMFALK